MKIIKLIPTIIKNFFLIIFYEIRKFFRRSKWVRRMLVILVVAVLAYVGWRVWYYYHPNPNDPNLSLTQAAQIGQVTTHKLLVQIENKNCPPSIANGCFERGDIVLIKPADFQFSDAEKEGFLILHMDITDKQAEVLIESLQQKAQNQPKSKTPNGQPVMDTLKIRKYAVDLKKIGIADNDQSGREVDTVYKWDVVKEK